MPINYRDLCEVISAHVRKLEFREKNINFIESSELFIMSIGNPPHLQRSYLTMLLFRILSDCKEQVPSNIRFALNVATDTTSWVSDIISIILPWMKLNEEFLFLNVPETGK